MGVMALPMIACDVEDTGDGTDATSQPDGTTTDTGADTTPTTTYSAVIVDDSAIFPVHRQVGTDPCATAAPPINAHGADIDAVGLFDGANLIGYLDVVDYQEGGLCPNKQNTMTDPDEAKGAPNATLTENFVSLGGGFLTGEFTGAPQLQSGDTLVVYEVGTKCANDTSCGGQDEGYEVFVATDIDCVNEAAYPYSSCGIRLTDDAEGEATIPVSGF
jgi:hypothetical protein